MLNKVKIVIIKCLKIVHRVTLSSSVLNEQSHFQTRHADPSISTKTRILQNISINYKV